MIVRRCVLDRKVRNLRPICMLWRCVAPTTSRPSPFHVMSVANVSFKLHGVWGFGGDAVALYEPSAQASECLIWQVENNGSLACHIFIMIKSQCDL
jgi:hypothetical protein